MTIASAHDDEEQDKVTEEEIQDYLAGKDNLTIKELQERMARDRLSLAAINEDRKKILAEKHQRARNQGISPSEIYRFDQHNGLRRLQADLRVICIKHELLKRYVRSHPEEAEKCQPTLDAYKNTKSRIKNIMQIMEEYLRTFKLEGRKSE